MDLSFFSSGLASVRLNFLIASVCGVFFVLDMILSFPVEETFKQASEIRPSTPAKVLCLFCVVTGVGTVSLLDRVLKNNTHSQTKLNYVQNFLTILTAYNVLYMTIAASAQRVCMCSLVISAAETPLKSEAARFSTQHVNQHIEAYK